MQQRLGSREPKKKIPSGGITHNYTLRGLDWHLESSEDVKKLIILPCLRYSYGLYSSSRHIRRKILYSIHGKDAISLRDMSNPSSALFNYLDSGSGSSGWTHIR